ncbi:MAG: aerial mycelium formation protein [Acidimicrobiales bacterium]
MDDGLTTSGERVSPNNESLIDRILSPSYLGDLPHRSIEDIRAMRATCQEVETGLSYLRRMVQGRLDIVGVEIQRRRDGGDPGELADLVERLPEILADRSRPAGLGRLPQLMAPGEIDAPLAAELDAITAGHDLATLASAADDDLERFRQGLEQLERDVSQRRRAMFEPIDALQAEITRRYRTGEADVAALLRSPMP